MSSCRSIPAPAGEPVRDAPGNQFVRSIPAPAGEPRPATPRPGRGPVYPRACGGTYDALLWAVWLSGLSPRLRGNLDGIERKVIRERSIPAPAGEPKRVLYRASAQKVYPRAWGEPISASTRASFAAVYPRACGGTHPNGSDLSIAHGLSPRLRGNQVDQGGYIIIVRCIPAPAGEPDWQPADSTIDPVYPRACGGTM